jgi:hypothetical protein
MNNPSPKVVAGCIEGLIYSAEICDSDLAIYAQLDMIELEAG